MYDRAKLSSGVGKNGRYSADYIVKYILLDQNVRIPIEIPLKFVHKCPIHNIPALVNIMAWYRPDAKPLVYWQIYASVCMNELMQFDNHFQWKIACSIYGVPDVVVKVHFPPMRLFKKISEIKTLKQNVFITVFKISRDLWQNLNGWRIKRYHMEYSLCSYKVNTLKIVISKLIRRLSCCI